MTLNNEAVREDPQALDTNGSSEHTLPPIPKPNWQIRLLAWFLRLVKACRGVHTVEKVRKRVARYQDSEPKLPPGITHERKTLAGLTCDRLLNDNAEYTVMHLYGGAGCLRMPSMEMPSIAKFCQRINAQAYLPWYSLAPEHKFPQATEDCVNAYKALLDQGVDPGKLVLTGSSAGGGYLLSLLVLLKRQALPMPACAVLLSPSGDCIMAGSSWHENARKDPLFTVADVVYFQHLLFSPEQHADPLVNVSLMEDFSGYPPLYFSASSSEVLRDVSVMAHQKAQAAGVVSQLDIFPGGIHCLPLMTFANQAKVIWQRIDHFVLQQLNNH